MLEYHLNSTAETLATEQILQLLTTEDDLSRGRGLQTDYNPAKSRLATTRLSYERDSLSSVDFEIYPS